MTAEEKQDYGVAVPECIRNGTNYPVEEFIFTEYPDFADLPKIDNNILKDGLEMLRLAILKSVNKEVTSYEA